MAFKIVIAGVDKTSFVIQRPGDEPHITMKQNERSTATFLLAPGYVPNQYDVVTIYDVNGTTAVFGGVVNQCQTKGIEPASSKHFTVVNCIDFMIYTDWTFWTKTYTATTTIKQILTDIISTNLSAYGITLDAAQDTGDTIQPFTVTNAKVSDYLRSLATGATGGRVLTMSPAGALRCVVPGTSTTPFSVSDAAPNSTSVEWQHSTFTPATQVKLVCGPSGQIVTSVDITVGISYPYLVFIPPVIGGWIAGDVIENPNTSPVTRTVSPIGQGGYYYWDDAGVTFGQAALLQGTGSRPSNGTVLRFVYTGQYPFTISVPVIPATPVITAMEFDTAQMDYLAGYYEANGILGSLDQVGTRDVTITTYNSGASPAQAMSVQMTNREIPVAKNFIVTQVDAVFTEYEQSGVRLWFYTIIVNEATIYQGSYLDQFRQMVGGAGSKGINIVSAGNATGGGTASNTIAPTLHATFDLGTTSTRWNNVYAETINAGTSITTSALSVTTLTVTSSASIPTLTVSGNAEVDGVLNFDASGHVSIEEDLAGRIRIAGTTSGVTKYIGWDGVQLIPFDDATKNLGAPSFRWNTVYASVGTINTSDAREKNILGYTTQGVDFLMALRPVDYFWKDVSRGTELRHGFVAQEVPTYFGGLQRQDDGPWGLDYAQFIAPIVSGLQNHETLLQALEQAVSGQKSADYYMCYNVELRRVIMTLRHVAAAFVIVVVLGASLAAQNVTDMGSLHSHVDSVAANIIFGWSADCATGLAPTTYTLTRLNDDGSVTSQPISVVAITRPDVQAYFASIGCHGGAVSTQLGWAIIPLDGSGNYTSLSSGHYQIIVTNPQQCGYNAFGTFYCPGRLFDGGNIVSSVENVLDFTIN